MVGSDCEFLLQNISDGFAVFDAYDCLVMCNSRYRDLMGVGNRDQLPAGLRLEWILRGLLDRGLIAHAGATREAWVAAQTGDWYGYSHRAASATVEAGHRWTRAPWRPWLRAGYLWASGDGNGDDHRHATFFQLLPSSRKYALSSTYAQMNLSDAFAQLAIEPSRVRARIEVHALHLASGADLWYQGSGATASHDRYFGFSGRAADGASSLGTVLESAVDVPIGKHWSINGYAGVMSAGDAVRKWFTNERLAFWYIENVIRF